MCSLLALLASTDLRSPHVPEVYCLDASLGGGGSVRTTVSPQLAQEMLLRRDRRGGYTSLGTSPVTAQIDAASGLKPPGQGSLGRQFRNNFDVLFLGARLRGLACALDREGGEGGCGSGSGPGRGEVQGPQESLGS